MRKSLLISSSIFTFVAVIIGANFAIKWSKKHRKIPFFPETAPIGTVLDHENGVAIYSNGDEAYKSHGKHFSKDGYYYGRRWQCVEFVKRYY